MDNLSLSLQITVIGMGLVFAAILLLWGMMAALVRLTPDRAEAGSEAEPEAPAAEQERKRRAAAAAVAVALAQADTTLPHEFPEPPTAIVSAWQAVQRSRQLSQRGPRPRQR